MRGNHAFGEFLRSRRSRLRPGDVGLAAGRPRRTPGLLREEVAGLAGISTEWYVRLEQGRAVSPSAGTVAALGRALRLTEVERRHLLSLARGGARPPFRPEAVPDGLRRLVEGLSEPAYVTGQRWDVLAWNRGAADLLADFALVPAEDRNVLLFMFTDPRARRLFGAGWAGEARRMVSLFRPTHDLWAGDPAFARLVERLAAGCSEFGPWWAAHDVAAPVSGRKTLYRADGTARALEHASFQANDDPSLKLALYVERDGPAAGAVTPGASPSGPRRAGTAGSSATTG